MDKNQKDRLSKFKSLLGDINIDELNTIPQTINPLPSTNGSTAVPIVSTSPNNTTPVSYNPGQKISKGSSAGGSYQTYDIINRPEYDQAIADKAQAKADALAYNNQLPQAMANLNSKIVSNPKKHDLFGNRIPDNYVPVLPLPVMPEKIDIPNLQTASRGESWNRSEREALSSGLPKPKLFLKNTKLKVDGGTGTLGVETVDTPNYSQDSGIDTLSKKSNLQNVRVIDGYNKQTRPRAFNKDTVWTVESGTPVVNGKRGETNMKGDMYDAQVRHAGNMLIKIAPDLLDMSKVKKNPQTGNYDFSNRNLPLRQEKAFDIIDGNGRRIPFNKGTWSKVKDKPGYEMVSNIRYDQVLNDITESFLAANGMPNTGRYDQSKALYTTYDQATRDAMNSAEWKAFQEQHLNNQRISDAVAMKWKLIYGNTL